MLENLIYFGTVFILVLLVYVFFINKKRLKKLGIIAYKKSNKKGSITDRTVNDLGEVSYLFAKFKLNKDRVNFKEILLVSAFINAFIMAFTCMVIAALPLQLIWKLMIGFVILFALVYACYEIYGRILVKRGWKK